MRPLLHYFSHLLGLQVGSVSAEDKDGSDFNALSYAFQSASEDTELFNIDETSGLLTTRQPLDREVKDDVTHTRPYVRGRLYCHWIQDPVTFVLGLDSSSLLYACVVDDL